MAQLKMEMTDLNNVPDIPMPDGYILRAFQDGDEAGVARIYEASNLGSTTAEAVRENMLGDERYKPGRIFVIEHNGELVGTSAAWTDKDDPSAGYLHMVGALPGHRGKKLGAILTVASINKNREDGFSVQRLHTDDDREAAVRLYLDLGYVPLFTEETHPGRWQAVAERIDRTAALAKARWEKKPETADSE
ncbi:MAG: GNAT family N-acetyltransferase [bacterium]|nr:GNAT family N-acetyltransferase [bacterium]